MEGHKLLWGDFHTHLEDLDHGDDIVRAARDNIDFYAVLCYPFLWERKNGFRVETVGQRPEFLEWWADHTRLAADHNDPGRFVTFLGYEWHGDRTRWGDHNVIYREGVGELDATMNLAELYERLRGRSAFAIPHHTAYRKGRRGKDWDIWDRELSPVMEIYSCHGSSEGSDTPVHLLDNSSMGPRASGGSFRDALARGIRIGVIGSNDGGRLPGRWNMGRAAVWAKDATRKDIWEAIATRRTYAVTGDRIRLDFSVAGVPMGAEGRASGPVDASVAVVGSHAIDRIELIRNGRVVDTCCHNGRWEEQTSAKRFKLRFVAGWGPCATYGYKPPDRWGWDCAMDVAGGTLVGVEKCFDLMGQRVEVTTPRRCEWHLETAGRNTTTPHGMTQGLVFEIEGTRDTQVHIEAEGQVIEKTLGELSEGPHVIPLLAESERRVRETFGLEVADLGNLDPLYHNARKIKLHRAVPEAAWRLEHTFGDVELERGANDFTVRVTQTNGQLAWSSPVWIDRA